MADFWVYSVQSLSEGLKSRLSDTYDSIIPYPQEIYCKASSGCLKLRVAVNPAYTVSPMYT